MIPTSDDQQALIRDLVEKAAALRPRLRERQADTEARTFPGPDIYEAISEAGLFHMLKPKRYGGYELSLNAFYQVVIEIARGCPSTGWWFALGAGHAVQIASYFSAEAQEEIFGFRKNFVAPWSFASSNVKVTQVDGGYRISGNWYYSSGVPYASHFMGHVYTPPKPGEAVASVLSFVIPEGQFTRLDNWGELLGMKGSGSHGVAIDDVFVPDRMTLGYADEDVKGPTIGYEVHRNPLYSGNFIAFAEGGIAAVATGIAYAAIDEGEELIATRNTPRTATLRAFNPDYQRSLGMAIAWADSARAITLNGADLYLAHAVDNVRGASPFSLDKALRMEGSYYTVEQLAKDVVEIMVRTASSGALRDEARLTRYLRDITMCVSRGHDQFEFKAANIAREVLKRSRGLSF